MAIHYGYYTLLRPAGHSSYGHKQSLVRCVCGTERTVLTRDLELGKTKSCGCKARKLRAVSLTTHGGTGTPLYVRWKGMKQRCLDPKSKAYAHYGGRGIKVCKRWMNFANFRAEMGPSFDPALTLDRIDVDGDYEPSNCRWATQAEQVANRRARTRAGRAA